MSLLRTEKKSLVLNVHFVLKSFFRKISENTKYFEMSFPDFQCSLSPVSIKNENILLFLEFRFIPLFR